MNEFRVRKTHGGSMWVVADGSEQRHTFSYLNEDGIVVNYYCAFKTKISAEYALDLYLKKQQSTTLTLATNPEYYSQCEIKLGDMREFKGGATRDSDNNKLDYEGFNNPLVDKCYAKYLNKHRQTANGLRDSDNWQNLFGDMHFDVCMKALCRHIVDARLVHRGYKSEQSIEDSLNAVIFNAKAYLLKLLLNEETLTETTPGHSGDVQEV